VTAAQVELFGEPDRIAPEPPADLTSGERLRERQAANIRQGLHPLGDLPGGPRHYGIVHLHPDASRATSRQDAPAGALTCGRCVHRQLVHGGARDYPKCTVGRQVHRSPAGDPPGSAEGIRTIPGPRETHGARTDVRAWWPACTDYAEIP
jgi:hypothetical protein